MGRFLDSSDSDGEGSTSGVERTNDQSKKPSSQLTSMVKVGVLNLQLNIDLDVNMLYATMQMYNTLMQPNLCTNL